MEMRLTLYFDPQEYWPLKAKAEQKSLTVTEYIHELIQTAIKEDLSNSSERTPQ